MKDDLPPEAPPPEPVPAPRPRRLALRPRPAAPELEAEPFPGFAPPPAEAPLAVAGPSVSGEGGRLRAVGTFGCSALAGLVLTTFSVVPTHTAGAPRSVRLEREARRRAQAAEVLGAAELGEGPRDRRDGTR